MNSLIYLTFSESWQRLNLVACQNQTSNKHTITYNTLMRTSLDTHNINISHTWISFLQCLVFTLLFCTACVSQGQICLSGIDGVQLQHNVRSEEPQMSVCPQWHNTHTNMPMQTTMHGHTHLSSITHWSRTSYAANTVLCHCMYDKK